MKALAVFLIGLMAIVGSVAQAADLVTSGQIGAIQYYAVSTTKSLKIQAPWTVKVSLTDAGSGQQRYFVSLYSEMDTRLSNKPEMAQLRAQFPGYKVDSAIPTQLQSIQADLGDGNVITIPVPSTSQNFFSQTWFLDAKTGAGIWAKWATGTKPTVTIQAQVRVPAVIPGETFELPLRELCPKSQKRETVESLLGSLVSSLQPIYARLKTADMKQLVLSTAIESCIQMGDASTINSISDVLKLSANTPDQIEDVQLSTDRVDQATQTTVINTEIETSEIK